MDGNFITYKDLDKILRYSRIYGLANSRQDILKLCVGLEGRYDVHGTGGTELAEDDAAAFGRLLPYATASAGSCGRAAPDVCRIVQEHCGLMDGDTRASEMAVADMLKDPDKGDECPFSILYHYIEKEAAGKEACEIA